MAGKQLTVFQRALLDAVLMEYEDIPPEEELEDHFSPEFNRWAEALMEDLRRKALRRRRTVRVILIAAVVACFLAFSAMAIPAVRERIIDFFFHDQGEGIGVSFDPESAAAAPKIIETYFSLDFIPEGYVITKEINAKSVMHTLWENGDELKIIFSQIAMPEEPGQTSWFWISADSVDRKTALLSNFEVEIFYYQSCYLLLWTDNCYFFSLELPSSIDEPTMEKIVLSCKPIS